MAHIEGHRAMVVGDPTSQHKRFVEIDEMGIAAQGLGKDVGLEDGGCILKGDNPESLPTHGKRYRHAVHQTDSIKHRRKGIGDVVLDATAEFVLDHQKFSARSQRAVRTAQHCIGCLLVVYGIKRGNEIEFLVARQIRHINHVECEFDRPMSLASARA